MEKTRNTPALIERFPALRKLTTTGKARQLPFIQQLSATECGAACLAMVLGYYGKQIPLSDVRDVPACSVTASMALALLQAARWYGLRGRGVRLGLEALPYLAKGAILHWELAISWSSSAGAKMESTIVDPAYGRRWVPDGAVQPLVYGCGPDL